MTETALVQAVELVYDALADDGALERLTGGLATILGASTGWFPLMNTTTGEMRLMAPHNVPLGAVWDYSAYYHEKDPWLAAAARRPPNTAMRLEEDVPSGALKRTEMYADYALPYFGGMTYSLGARIPMGDEIAFIGLHRTERQGPFSEDAGKIFEKLISPLRRLLQVRKRLEALHNRAKYLEDACDRFAFGVMRCDRDGRIVYANRASLDFIARQDGLRGILGSRIGTIEQNDSERLSLLIASAVSGQPPASGAATVRRLNGKPAYRVVVAPMRPPDAEPASLLLIDDPQSRDPDLAGTLAGLYNLDKTEVALALALMRNESFEEFAALHRLSLETVRSLTTTLFLKTGVRRQIDLVGLLSRLPMTATTGR